MRPRLVVLIAVVALLVGALLAVVIMQALKPSPSAPPTRPPVQTPARPPVQATVDFIDTFDGLDTSRWGVSDRAATGDWMENDWRQALAIPGREGVDLTMARSGEGSASPLSSAEI